jgi:APA family basic amino acid/polyamine antiporter
VVVRGLHGGRIGFGDCGRGLRDGGGVSRRIALAAWSMPYACVLDLLKDDDDMAKVHLQRRLGFKESFAIVVGSIIGTGVFLKTAVMAQDAGPPLYVLLAWLVAGVLSFMGALTYAELSCLFPAAGGEYVFLREAYGPLTGFLFGWTRFWIASPGSIAAYAIGSVTFLESFLPMANHRIEMAIAIIVFFTVLNCFSVHFGGGVQAVMTAVKIIMIFGLAASISVLFLYAGANLAYLYALPFEEVVNSHSTLYPDALPVATKAALQSFGGAAVAILSLAFVFSALGAMNGTILTGARVPYAMARDGLMWSWLGEANARTHSPVGSTVVQGLWACVLAASGTFDQLTDCIVFASWIFYALNTFSLFYFRRKLPAPAYRTPAFPWPPVIFIACALLLIVNTLWTTPTESLAGLGLIAAGIPVYFLFRNYRSPTEKIDR